MSGLSTIMYRRNNKLVLDKKYFTTDQLLAIAMSKIYHKKGNTLRYFYSLDQSLSYDMNIALRRLLHNHGNIATEGSPKSGLCPCIQTPSHV